MPNKKRKDYVKYKSFTIWIFQDEDAEGWGDSKWWYTMDSPARCGVDQMQDFDTYNEALKYAKESIDSGLVEV